MADKEIKCVKCEDVGVLWKDGNWQECECKIKERFRRYFAKLLPAPPLTKKIKEMSDKVVNLEMSPKKILIDTFKNKEEYKTFLIYHMARTKKESTFKLIKSYFLIDLYLNKFEDETMYSYSNDTFVILHGFSDFYNKQELNIMSTFIDIYIDKDIFVYSNASGPVLAELRSKLLNKGFKALK